MKKHKQEIADKYQYLIRRLEIVNWAIQGSCDDIDCDQYTYKELLKEEYAPVLEHGFSCMKHLHSEKAALLRVLSLKRYNNQRYTSCDACKKELDSLGEEYAIIGYTKKIPNKKMYEWRSFCVHNNCREDVSIPEGWKQM